MLVRACSERRRCCAELGRDKLISSIHQQTVPFAHFEACASSPVAFVTAELLCFAGFQL